MKKLFQRRHQFIRHKWRWWDIIAIYGHRNSNAENDHYEDDENPKVEGEVNMEEELTRALEELRKVEIRTNY